ncbi:hypothetical protein POVCU2_0047790 [Plasmodium ovale curtisi]|uniref:Uncharacterized protein n=1 Tax=Plasmodium ovale curtisi TaxID=864141 RepID=A0A1A8WZ01_PLAOA|nr:hypothetical protein POVCU2_0047790 [Plasmodium ovale curtisi]SBS98199.1 hypothetical protein POVCU1_044280 [Plasmodium ovale curtisi]
MFFYFVKFRRSFIFRHDCTADGADQKMNLTAAVESIIPIKRSKIEESKIKPCNTYYFRRHSQSLCYQRKIRANIRTVGTESTLGKCLAKWFTINS